MVCRCIRLGLVVFIWGSMAVLSAGIHHDEWKSEHFGREGGRGVFSRSVEGR